MTTGDLIKALFRSYKQGDDGLFMETAQKIITEEKNKNHNVLARDLQRILNNGENKSSTLFRTIPSWQKLPTDRESGLSLIDIREPNRLLSDLLFTQNLERQINDIALQYRRRDVLRSYRLNPKQKILFAGPPGCGKTITAEALSTELGLPLLYTRFDSVVSSYLGETATNLRKIFDFASRGTWIVFFDEFDAVGKSREDATEHGELKRVVNTFLQLLDGFESDSIFVAATNHQQLLDKALWRRFDDVLFFELPTIDDIIKLIEIKLRNFPHQLVYSELAEQFQGWSHADVERVCIESIKWCILEDVEYLNKEIFNKIATEQKNRIEIIQNNIN